MGSSSIKVRLSDIARGLLLTHINLFINQISHVPLKYSQVKILLSLHGRSCTNHPDSTFVLLDSTGKYFIIAITIKISFSNGSILSYLFLTFQ